MASPSRPPRPMIPASVDTKDRPPLPRAAQAVLASKRAQKPGPTLDYERVFWDAGVRVVAACDEVGRGPLAGPSLAAAVILRPDADLTAFLGVNDSKKLTPERITMIGQDVIAGAYVPFGLVAWAAGGVSAREIDRLNIHHAIRLAMTRAVRRAERAYQVATQDPTAVVEHVIVDGQPLGPTFPWMHSAQPKLDATSISTALSACVAKYLRDRCMKALGKRYPHFACWETNVGYGAAEHLAALAEHGPIPGVHRYSFAPIKGNPAWATRTRSASPDA